MDTSQKTTESSSKMLETLEERLASANLAIEAARRLQMMEKLSPSTSLEQEVRLRQELQLLEQEIKDKGEDIKEN